MKQTFLKHAVAFLLSAFASPFSSAAPESFIHPGGLHTQADFERMKSKVAAGEHPWIDGWEVLLQDRKARSDYKAAPHRHMASRQRAQDDATAAYLNALRWVISGEKDHAECAVKILNSWSDTVKEVPRGPDQPGLSGIPIGSFALAAEVLRTYPGWSGEEQEKFKSMLLHHFYPVCHDFLTRHNGASDTNYWANWDTCNMLAVLAIGVFCDDRDKFNEAVEYYENGRGTGAIRNAVPFIYPDGLGQWQESGRDQAHAMGGMGLLVQMCQVAWNQGVDLFGYDDNRLLKGGEYTAQYTIWKGVPYTFYTNSSRANQYFISQNYHGRLAASHFELMYNHYVVRKGLSAPHVELFAKLKRPEPGDVDVFGYGTLAFTLDAAASPLVSSVPPVPLDLTAAAGIGRVDLKWSPSGSYAAQGYEVLRSTTKGGPYTSLYSTTNFTTPHYSDTKVTPGTTYHYVVAAINQAGTSEHSIQTSATPVEGTSLPEMWKYATLGKSEPSGEVAFNEAANQSFILSGTGRSIGGSADECSFINREVSGDFTITARLIDRQGDISMAGLMMRDGPAADAKMLALTLGEIGGRQARFRTRSSTGGKSEIQFGNDYTWIPAWFRLQRVGNVFTAYQSSDGIEWFVVGSSTVSMSKSYLVGLVAHSSGDSEGAPGSVAFDNVTAEIAIPLAPKDPGGLLAGSPKGAAVGLSWKHADDKAVGFKIEAATEEAGQFYEIADLVGSAVGFTNTGLRNPKSMRYRIRAYNRGGYSPYSNVAMPSR
ncbi:MAG: alginate lyase family protein [Verrucomicrobiota bacterium]